MSVLPTKNPTRLGRYEILDEIGKGAMGVVFLAKDPLIGRLVALKTFRIGYSVKDQEMEQFRARFMREAQSAGILSHPNIVTIHDVVEQGEEGIAFIAMEYVRGTNLKMLLQREPSLDLSYVAGILEQIADGLDYAHSKGVVHRDIKPANIIITADNRVKITDFGIARIDTSNLTQEGQLLGTPNYMAPEQILGREIDHRADIFSLGVVLYEMLTRHKPFQGENLTVVSHRIVYDHFTPPKDYVDNLQRGVEPILSRALDKDPGRRYQRAREMADDLSRLVHERMTSESLNETLSVNSTMVAPPEPPAPAPVAPAAPKRPRLLRAIFGERKGAPAPAAAPNPPALAVIPVLPEPPPPVAPFPPPPPPLPPSPIAPLAAEAGTGTGTGTGAATVSGTGTGTGSSGTLLPAAPLPPLAVPPPAPPRPGPPSRLVPVLWAAAVLLLVAMAVAGWLWTRGRQPRLAARPAAAPPAVTPMAPVAPAPTAIPPAPQGTEAAAQATELARQAAEQKTIADRLQEAGQALAGKHYDAAATAASAVLALAPANPEAQQILNTVEKARNKRRDRLASQAKATPAARPAEVLPRVPQATTLPPATPVPTDATLAVNFVSNLPEGILVVYVNDQQMMKEPFDFWKKTGFLRRAPGKGSVTQNLQVPVGTAHIRVYVTTGGKARVQERSGNFPGGSVRTLNATLNADGTLTANLE